MPANRRTTGAADAVIIPTIITSHIANVKKTSAAVHGMSIVMPMSAIFRSYSIAADIWRSRWKRYAQARAVRRTRQLEMTTRSRPESAAVRLSAFPGEGRVLTVVFSGHVVPRESERVHVTPGRVRERERIRGRMAGVLEPQLRIGVQALGALGGHVDEVRRPDGPFRARAIEGN